MVMSIVGGIALTYSNFTSTQAVQNQRIEQLTKDLQQDRNDQREANNRISSLLTDLSKELGKLQVDVGKIQMPARGR